MKTKATDKADGKQTNQLRALKDGMEIVITAAGERPENYERFEAWAWDYWQPDDVTEETWTDDFVANWWQRERARRCRSAAIWNSLQNLGINRVYMSSDEVEALKIRFQLSFERYRTRTSSTTSGDLDKIVTELGSVRSQLASTSEGCLFLIEKLKSIKEEVERTGQMSPASESALCAYGGLTNDMVLSALRVNQVKKLMLTKAAGHAEARKGAGPAPSNRAEPEKAKRAQGAGPSDAEEWSLAEKLGQILMVSAIDLIALTLSDRKRCLESNEERLDKTRWAAAVLTDENTYERLDTMEAALDRRLNVTIEALLAKKRAKCFQSSWRSCNAK